MRERPAHQHETTGAGAALTLADQCARDFYRQLVDGERLALPREARTGEAFLPPHVPDAYARSHTHLPDVTHTARDGRLRSVCGYDLDVRAIVILHPPTCAACLKDWRVRLQQWDDVTRPLASPGIGPRPVRHLAVGAVMPPFVLKDFAADVVAVAGQFALAHPVTAVVLFLLFCAALTIGCLATAASRADDALEQLRAAAPDSPYDLAQHDQTARLTKVRATRAKAVR